MAPSDKMRPAEEAKHTPGPWELGVVRGNALTFILDKMRSIVGTVEHHGDLGKWWQVTVPGEELIIGETGCGPTSEANARLIAAAPDILAALEEAIQYIKGCGLDGKAHVRARTAIAKARGEG